MNKTVLTILCLFVTIPSYARTITISPDGSGDYPTIQAAIDDANDGDVIILNPGTYTGPGNQKIDYKGKAITVRSTDPDDPNIVASTVIDGNGAYCFADFDNNETHSSILAGFTIKNYQWYAIYITNCSPTITNCIITKNELGIRCRQYWEGITRPTISGCVFNRNKTGIFCIGDYCEPTITNCTITENHNDHNDDYYVGGGVLCSWGSKARIVNCTISNNSANKGGGIYCRQSNPRITSCVITNNLSLEDGGGIYCESSSPVIKNSTISLNSADYGGGIFCSADSLPIITGCYITDNTSDREGGGIYAQEPYKQSKTGLILNSCIISGNRANRFEGGGLYGWGGEIRNCTITDNYAHGSHPPTKGGGLAYCYGEIINSVIWGNSTREGNILEDQILEHTSTISYSCIQDDDPNDGDIPFGGADAGNIDDDPLFSNYPDDLHLRNDSPCIDAGEPNFIDWPGNADIDGDRRVSGPAADMGADEQAIPKIVVTKPAGGEVWAAGSRHRIKWDSYYVQNVDVIFSDDGGRGWKTVAEDIDAHDCDYMWQLPKKVDSEECIVAVVPATEDVEAVVIESGLFEINKLSKRPAVPPGKPDRNKQRRTGFSENIGPELGCVKWSFQTGGPVTASVALGHNNHIYVPCEDGKLYALNNSGELIWSFDANFPIISTPAIDARGTVYVGADDGVLYALKHNGKLLWSFATGSFIYGSPAVGPDGNIYVASTDGFLYALSPDGSELWKFETAGLDLSGNSIFATPVISPGGMVCIAGFYDPNLYGLDADNGSVKWVRTLIHPEPLCPDGYYRGDTQNKTGWPFASSVLTDDGVIYQTALYDPNLYAIDSKDGSIIWTSKMKPQCSFIDPFICWTATWIRFCYLIEELCGSDWYGVPLTEWYNCQMYGSKYQGSGRSSDCWSRPAVGPNGTIYVSFDDPYLRAVDPNGSIKWVKRIGTVGGFTLTVGPNGLIYATGDDGNMYVLNSNGDELSRFETDECLSWPAITVGSTVIVSDYNDTVWAIGGGDCSGGLSELHRPSDLNADRIVNMFDFAKLANNWPKNDDEKAGPMRKGAYPEGDVNVDGFVNAEDVFQMAENWMKEE